MSHSAITVDSLLEQFDALTLSLGDVEMAVIGSVVKIDHTCVDDRVRYDYLTYAMSVLEGRSRAGQSRFEDVVKSSYFKGLISRPFRMLKIKARQKLDHSAPTIRLMQGKKTKTIFVSRPPIAPPAFA